MISKADKKFLNEHGYLIVRNFFNDKQLKFLTEYSLDIEKKALEGNWKYIKIYREYPKFKYLNVFGVEYPFNSQINKHVFKEFSNLNYKNFFCDVVGWEDLKTTLVRLHTNLNFFKYQGEWHRDNLYYPSPEKFQSVIYLKKEKGFKIVPRSKNQLLEKYDIPVDKPPKKGQGFFKLDKNIYHEIEAERGDLLIFEAGLLHQGYVKGSRLHYHIRHEKIVKKNLNLNNPFNFIEKYLPDYDLKNEYYEPRYFQSNLNLIFMRIRTLFFYFTPRIKEIFFNLVNKKNKKTISHSTIWQ